MLRRLLPLSVFARYERWWARRHHLIDLAPDCFVRLELRSHRGPTVRLQDGTLVRPGDRLAEIHIDSLRLAELYRTTQDPRRMGLLFGRGMVEGLRLVARYLQAHSEAVVAVHATSLYWMGSERLGFEIHPIRNPFVRFGTNVWLKFLLGYYHPEGVRRIWASERLREPREAWMSERTLFQRYGSPAPEKLL
jgi:hypothetical protein